MAERSIKAGYLKDSLKYLHIAHEAEPADFDVMLQLGWAYNMLHQDDQAVRWFDLARRSEDPKVALEAGQAWKTFGQRASGFERRYGYSRCSPRGGTICFLTVKPRRSSAQALSSIPTSAPGLWGIRA
jgi:hypothetical protein